jgi:hypothetical protein
MLTSTPGRRRSSTARRYALSYVIALVALRLLAAADSLRISACGVAPPGSLLKAVAARTSPAVGLVGVIGAAYVLLALAVAPLAARLIAARRPARNGREKAKVTAGSSW